MAITPLPNPPLPTDTTSEFNTKAFAWVAALDTFTTEANQVASDVSADEASAAASAATASSAAQVAAGAVNFQGEYNAGTTYQIGESVVYNNKIYIAKVVTTGVLPTNTTNWFVLENGDVTTDGTQTLTNKTLDDPIISLNGSEGTSGQVATSQGAGLPPLWQTLPASAGQITAVATGSISGAGVVVSLNSDGTVSATTGNDNASGTAVVVESLSSSSLACAYDANANKVIVAYRVSTFGNAIVGTISGNSISFGSAATFSSNSPTAIDAIYDASQQKVVICYYDSGAGNSKSVVATISGTSVSFGTPVTFESGQAGEPKMAYDSANQKIVIAYQDVNNSSYGTAVVGTVSGTSISFGSPVLFRDLAGVSKTSIAYDSGNGKIVIAYQDAGMSNKYRAIVGTVSGTSMSFGTAVDVYGGVVAPDMAYDANAGKIVITFRENVANTKGYAIVGTVSGTSISFGTAVLFNDAVTNDTSVVYDSNLKKMIISYRDNGNSNYGTVVVGTVTGTTMTFGSELVFESAATSLVSSVYDSSSMRTFIAYIDEGNSSYPTGVVFQPASSTNSQRIGIAQSSATNGQSVQVKTLAGIDSNQTGLTIGSTYYVTTLGALTTTSTNNPRIGIALKADTLLITDAI